MTSEAVGADAEGPRGLFRQWVAGEVRAHLARASMSQRGLSRALGVTAPWVNERLSGRQAMSTDDLERIAGALGLSPMDLLVGGAPPPTTRGPVSSENRGFSTHGYVGRNRRLEIVRPLFGCPSPSRSAPEQEPAAGLPAVNLLVAS